MKASVRKGDTKEDADCQNVMEWADTGQRLFSQQRHNKEALKD